MLNLPHRIQGITHPLVKEIYYKQELGLNNRHKNVLVIEAMPSNKKDHSSDFADLLMDLHTIQLQAEANAQESDGHFDRVDIVTH